MAAADSLTAARLREVLHYDPKTGVFTWLVTRGAVTAGDVAGSANSNLYLRIAVDGRKYQAHRLAWLYMRGEWPPHQIDHRDTDKLNNRWKNIRPATNRQNGQNKRKAQANNKSGFLGVRRRGNKYGAAIEDNGKELWLGTFEAPEPAHAAYLEAKAKHHEYQTLVEAT